MVENCRMLGKEEIDLAIKEYVLNKYGQKVSEFGFVIDDGKVDHVMADLEDPKYSIGSKFLVRHPECNNSLMKWTRSTLGPLGCAVLTKTDDSDEIDELKIPLSVIINLTEPEIVYPDSFLP